MHKIFCIPELLDEIFSYSSRHTNTITARVCQLWFARSIPFVWNVVKLNHALGVFSSNLGDIFEDKVLLNDNGQPLLPHSWDRFLSYSTNVRYLDCVDMKYAIFKQMILCRPFTDLFSNLTVLNWDGREEHIEYLSLLLTSTLRILRIELGVLRNPDTIDILRKTLPARSPSLRVFRLHVRLMINLAIVQTVSPSLTPLLSLLFELISVTIPTQYMTPHLLVNLSRLPKLEDLVISDAIWGLSASYVEAILKRQMIDKDDEASYRSFLPFRSLRRMVISEGLNNPTFTMAKALGNSGIEFHKLVGLTYSPWETYDKIVPAMELIHVVCPNLQKMTILGNIPVRIFPCGVIRALLKCPNLVDLNVSRCFVNMRLEDIITIATNRSSWKTIRLPSPIPVSYQALVAFAQNCPHLHTLGIILNDTLGLPDLKTDVRKLASLTLLDVQTSAIAPESQTEVATFLSRICVNPLTIKTGSFDGKHTQSWKAVEKMVNIIIANSNDLIIRIAKGPSEDDEDIDGNQIFY